MRLSLATLLSTFLAQQAGGAPIVSQDLEARGGSALECNNGPCAVTKVKRDPPSPVELAPRQAITSPGRPPLAVREIADRTVPEGPSPVELVPRQAITSPGRPPLAAREIVDWTVPEDPSPVVIVPRQTAGTGGLDPSENADAI
ncbi:hypothetical protein MAPG_06266 [Magnaporthiopsis poae ATCC 64411]|uniref:Uncharacterized protein n=1 Tax=Magnaporthiopsis poae (strain ATCC 64411 / 73-15) TaxID=644358 RepID=A0A0C4E1K2_MAGP6|nr:hypothetical protein MAPG_06266 [Magnaporthiopsis poae ATCC 64411]